MGKETMAASATAQAVETQQAAGQTTGPAAEPSAAAGQTTGPAAEPSAAAGTQTVKTYDQAYVDSLIEKQKAAQEAAVAEALKVAGMDADSKAKYQKEQEDQKLRQREADIARRELKADARGVLEEKEVPAEFLDMLLGKDMKETKANADAFKAAFDAAVQAQVEKRLVGKTPQTGNGSAVSEAEAMAAEIAKYM